MAAGTPRASPGHGWCAARPQAAHSRAPSPDTPPQCSQNCRSRHGSCRQAGPSGVTGAHQANSSRWTMGRPQSRQNREALRTRTRRGMGDPLGGLIWKDRVANISTHPGRRFFRWGIFWRGGFARVSCPVAGCQLDRLAVRRPAGAGKARWLGKAHPVLWARGTSSLGLAPGRVGALAGRAGWGRHFVYILQQRNPALPMEYKWSHAV